MTLKQLFDKINKRIKRFFNKWLSALDKLLDQGQYQPTNQAPTQYS